MSDFNGFFDAINEGVNGGMPGPLEEEPEMFTPEDGVVPGEKIVPGDEMDEEGEPNLDLAAEIISKITQAGTWEKVLQVYAEEHEMEIEAVKAEVISSLAIAGIEVVEPEVEVEVEISEVPGDVPELENELPQE